MKGISAGKAERSLLARARGMQPPRAGINGSGCLHPLAACRACGQGLSPPRLGSRPRVGQWAVHCRPRRRTLPPRPTTRRANSMSAAGRLWECREGVATGSPLAFNGNHVGTSERAMPAFPPVAPLPRGLIHQRGLLPHRRSRHASGKGRRPYRRGQTAAWYAARHKGPPASPPRSPMPAWATSRPQPTAGQSSLAHQRPAPSRRRWRAHPRHVPASGAGPAPPPHGRRVARRRPRRPAWGSPPGAPRAHRRRDRDGRGRPWTPCAAVGTGWGCLKKIRIRHRCARLSQIVDLVVSCKQ